MKPIAPIMAGLVLTACGQPAPSAPSAPEGKTARAPSSTPQQPLADVPAPSGVAAAVVPVGDFNPLNAPPAVYPALPGRFRDAAAVTAKGWRIERRLEGDLNGDGRADLALILREQNPANIVRSETYGGEVLDTNPRRLIVGFADGDGYRLAAENHTFIPRHVEPNIEDPLQEAALPEIRDGVLVISLNFFASAGSWTMFSSAARFRWQDGALRLIGHDLARVQRNSGEMLDRSVNFLTRRVRTVESAIDAESEPAPVWTRLPAAPLLTIDQVGDGLAFDPTGSN